MNLVNLFVQRGKGIQEKFCYVHSGRVVAYLPLLAFCVRSYFYQIFWFFHYDDIAVEYSDEVLSAFSKEQSNIEQ